MQFIFTSSNSSLSQTSNKLPGQNCLKYLKHFEFDGFVTRSGVSLWLGTCSKLPYLIVWWHTETKRTSFKLNLMITQIPVVCCLKFIRASENIFYFSMTQFHDIHDTTVPVITWAAHTRHMTGPHTKYFPTYFYNPDIFCLPFISFLLTGCSQDQWDAWRVAWHTHMFWHQKTAKKINECVCVIMTWVTSWHHHRAPGTGDRWRWPGIVCQQVPHSWLYDSYSAAIKSDVHKALIHTDNRGQLIMHLSQFSQAWQHFRETITCHGGQRGFI